MALWLINKMIQMDIVAGVLGIEDDEKNYKKNYVNVHWKFVICSKNKINL
jgi:hypothetical protein